MSAGPSWTTPNRRPPCAGRSRPAGLNCDFPEARDVLGLVAPETLGAERVRVLFPTGKGVEPMLRPRQLTLSAAASILTVLLAGAAAMAATSSCPLFSYFTTNPSPATDREPTLLTI